MNRISLLGLAAAIAMLSGCASVPMADKGMAGVDAFQTSRVAHAVEEGEKHLAAMKDAILRAGDREGADALPAPVVMAPSVLAEPLQTVDVQLVEQVLR